MIVDVLELSNPSAAIDSNPKKQPQISTDETRIR